MPKVSIIIPLYNKAPYIAKALDSVLAQTYTDYECIIINDGSSDNSEQIVSEWIEREGAMNNERLTLKGDNHFLIITQENAGVSVARNHGIAESKGKYLAFLDADDWWEPTFLENMVSLANKYPSAGVFACNYYKVKRGQLISFFDGPTGPANYFKMYHSIAMPITTNSVLVSRKLLDSVAIDRNGAKIYFKPEIKLGEDFDMWVRLCLKSQFVWCNEHLAYYNNDVPANSRAVGRLHAPQNHMLWNIDWLEPLEKQDPDYKAMIDNIRVYGLMPYYISKEYHVAAIEQLTKVDWEKQPLRNRLKYHLPVWCLIVHQSIMRCGSHFKQKILRLM